MENNSDHTSSPTKYWHVLEDGRVQCDVCPRACKLKNGQRGLCFVRACEDDKIVSTTYGRSSGYCIDPVEKKPLNHYLPGTPVLSFGTAGCNLACKFCQNWDISKSRELDTLMDQASPKRIAEAALQLKCKSVAYTYNDPTVFMEYAIDCAKACHEVGVKAIAVTAGYICPEPREELYQYMDAANVDLKGFTEEFYYKITGSHLANILDTLVYLKNKTKVWFEVTTLLIPGQNDSEAEIDNMTKWFYANLGVDVPLHFTAFHPDWKMRDIPPTPPETLTMARNIAIKNGLNYVYTGNVHDVVGGSTYCHNCHACVVKRDWYNILEYHLSNDGKCNFCQTQIPGVYAGPAGTWGAKRVPVRLGAITKD